MFEALGSTPAAVGRALATRHLAGDTVTPSLHDYVERLHPGGWSLRAALVRYAQPEPARAARFLDLTRRTDSGLKEHHRLIERTPRLSDLARALDHFGHDYPTLLDAYLHEADPLAEVETTVIPVLAVGASLDTAGAVVAAWAVEANDVRPDDTVEAACEHAAARLDALGVEAQDWYR